MIDEGVDAQIEKLLLNVVSRIHRKETRPNNKCWCQHFVILGTYISPNSKERKQWTCAFQSILQMRRKYYKLMSKCEKQEGSHKCKTFRIPDNNERVIIFYQPLSQKENSFTFIIIFQTIRPHMNTRNCNSLNLTIYAEICQIKRNGHKCYKLWKERLTNIVSK